MAATTIPPGTVIPTAVVPPCRCRGPNTVACSNVAQDFSRMAPGEEVKDYWEGCAGRRPQGALPDRSARRSGEHAVGHGAARRTTAISTGRSPERTSSRSCIVCYPTSAGNSRPDYPLPTGQLVPHMQTGAEPPLFADAATRYPLLAFSHGYAGSPLSDDYLAALSWFASYGYVVVAPFHGDPRISDLRIDDFKDAVIVLSHLGDFTALQAMRPLGDVGRARSRARASAMARPRRRSADRRLRGEHGRRDADADGRRRTHRDRRTVGDADHRTTDD